MNYCTIDPHSTKDIENDAGRSPGFPDFCSAFPSDYLGQWHWDIFFLGITVAGQLPTPPVSPSAGRDFTEFPFHPDSLLARRDTNIVIEKNVYAARLIRPQIALFVPSLIP
jgi:hypothetical protein